MIFIHIRYNSSFYAKKERRGGTAIQGGTAGLLMKKRMYAVFMAICMATAAAGLPFGTGVYAAETDVVEEEEPAGAEKGLAHVCAVLQEGHHPAVEVELVPQDGDGISYNVRLDRENGYAQDIQVMTGAYTCVCYVDTENGKYQSVNAVYGGTEETVTAGDSDAPYFVAVAGDSTFIKDNSWLSNYRTEDGTPLAGEITDERLQEIFNEQFAMPDEASAPQPGYVEEDSGDEGAPPEEYTSPAVEGAAGTTEEEEVQAPAVEEDGEDSSDAEARRIMVASIICIILITGAAAMIVWTLAGNIRNIRNRRKRQESTEGQEAESTTDREEKNTEGQEEEHTAGREEKGAADQEE